jgi:hypothetical protein
MKNIFVCSIALLILSYFSGSIAFAACSDARFMSNDHDTLIIGEITNVDEETVIIRAADYIVSSADLHKGNKKKQLKPQAVTVSKTNAFLLSDLKIGDYVIASLNKNGDVYEVAWGIYLVDSLDYTSLNVLSHHPSGSAMYTDFVNSGGRYNSFSMHGFTVTRLHNGEKTIIYSDQPFTDTTESSLDDPVDVPLEQGSSKPVTLPLHNIIGIGFITVMIGTSLFFILRRSADSL